MKEPVNKATEERTEGNSTEVAKARAFGDGAVDNNAGSIDNDDRMDAGMGRLLQAGVLLASAIVLAGGVLYLGAHGGKTANYRTFASEPAKLREWPQLFRAIAHGDAASIIQLGILFLIATPVARVAFAVVAFSLKRDRLYIGISVAVLVILLLSLFILS